MALTLSHSSTVAGSVLSWIRGGGQGGEGKMGTCHVAESVLQSFWPC